MVGLVGWMLQKFVLDREQIYEGPAVELRLKKLHVNDPLRPRPLWLARDAPPIDAFK